MFYFKYRNRVTGETIIIADESQLHANEVVSNIDPEFSFVSIVEDRTNITG